MTDQKQMERRPTGLTVDMVTELTGYKAVEIALISRTVAQDAPLAELAVFLHACRQLKLDPLLRQAYWIRRGHPPKGTLQVGIDGFRAIADRSGGYSGSEPAEYKDWTLIEDGSGAKLRVPGVARVRVWKVVEGRSAAFTGEAAWAEFYPGPGATGTMWRRMPRHMLAKVAEAQALRKAFPALLAAVAMGDEVGEEEAAPSRIEVTAAEYKRVITDDSFEMPTTPPAPPAASDDGQTEQPDQTTD